MVTSTHLDPLRRLNTLIKPLREGELVSVNKKQLVEWRDEIVRLKAFEPITLPFPMALFKGVKLTIFSAVQRAGSAGIQRDALASKVWNGNANGGPNDVNNNISQHITGINKTLLPRKLIVNAERGRYANAVYILQELK